MTDDQLDLIPKERKWWQVDEPPDLPTGPKAVERTPPYSEPTTSKEAAMSMAGKAEAQREAVYEHVSTAQLGATCDEVEASLSLPHQSASARLWELCGNNQLPARIVKTEEKRKTRTGRSARVYRVRKGLKA